MEGGTNPPSASPDDPQMLKRIAWLSDPARERLGSEGRLLRLRAHQPIYLERQAADQIFLLLAGIAKIYYSNDRGRVLVTYLRAGDTFGISGLLPDATRHCSSEAVTDCVVLGVDSEVFSEAVFGDSLARFGPAFAHTFGRWRDLAARYTRFVGLDARGRLALSLLELAEKFGVRDARGVLLPLSLSHAELGTMVGTSRQHVTTQLRDFERDGLIARAGRRLIVIPERLSVALEG